MTTRRNGSAPEVILAVCLVIVCVSLIGTVMYAAHINGERRASTVATCERGNVVRAKQNAVIVFLNAKFGYQEVPTPLVDCGALK